MPELYNPQYAVNLQSVTARPQFRVGLQGGPKTGKTYAATRFPNPVVVNFDRGLTGHIGENILDIPFYNPSFVDQYAKREGSQAPPNKKDALLVWLFKEGPKFSPEQTLIFDAITGIEAAHNTQYNLAPWITKNGKVDEWGIYKSNNQYFSDLGDLMKSLQCNVVMIAHETPDRDKNGDLNGLVRPLLAGQAGDKIASFFTDWFRCRALGKPTTPEQTEKAKKFLGVTDNAAWQEWMSSGSKDTFYFWQTQSDEVCQCGATSLKDAPKYMIAGYSSFEKYRKKIS